MGRNLKPEAAAKEREAQRRWHSMNTEYLNIGLRKGVRARYNLLAEHRGVSLASIVKNFLNEECEKEFGGMLKTFIFDGQEGQFLIENPDPNEYGNISARFKWGGIEEYPTFRSIEQAESFISDQDAIENFIDQASHSTEF